MSEIRRLPAEWEPQDAVLLTWPHAGTDWAEDLDEVLPLYEALAYVLTRECNDTQLVIAAPSSEVDDIVDRLVAMELPGDRIHLFEVPSNDTWARDHGPITVEANGRLKLLDFTFNAWGGKFESASDNLISRNLKAAGAFPQVELESLSLVLEGGAIESDGNGTLLTTERCLLNPNRNPELSREQIESELKRAFGVSKINWLKHGFLAGDDTDSHIDTLARLCPNNTIAYVKCDDETDEHFAELTAMEAELKQLTNAAGESYRLVPLPWPGPKYDLDGHRLPATYANFLVINGVVLVPTYDDFRDMDALEAVSQAFPGYEVKGIPALALIEQGGSLHCITMQLPKGALAGMNDDD